MMMSSFKLKLGLDLEARRERVLLGCGVSTDELSLWFLMPISSVLPFLAAPSKSLLLSMINSSNLLSITLKD